MERREIVREQLRHQLDVELFVVEEQNGFGSDGVRRISGGQAEGASFCKWEFNDWPAQVIKE
jgi:hypothetical protein